MDRVVHIQGGDQEDDVRFGMRTATASPMTVSACLDCPDCLTKIRLLTPSLSLGPIQLRDSVGGLRKRGHGKTS